MSRLLFIDGLMIDDNNVKSVEERPEEVLQGIQNILPIIIGRYKSEYFLRFEY